LSYTVSKTVHFILDTVYMSSDLVMWCLSREGVELVIGRSRVGVLLLLFLHAPVGVCSTKRRHQSPEWMIPSHVNCFIHAFQFLRGAQMSKIKLGLTQSGIAVDIGQQWASNGYILLVGFSNNRGTKTRDVISLP